MTKKKLRCGLFSYQYIEKVKYECDVNLSFSDFISNVFFLYPIDNAYPIRIRASTPKIYNRCALAACCAQTLESRQHKKSQGITEKHRALYIQYFDT